jgi:coproporphyrinogen III oxidase
MHKAEPRMSPLRERLLKLLDEIDHAVKHHKNHWETDRAKGMLDVAFDLKQILEDYPDEEK